MKSVKNLIVPFLIFIVLLITAISFYLYDLFASKRSSDTSQDTITIYYVDPNEVSSIEVTNSSTGYVSVVNCFHDSTGDISYEYKGSDYISTESYSQSKLQDYVYALTCYYSKGLISSSGNFKDYSLDNPEYSVQIRLNDGSVNTIYLGICSPDNQYCYMCLKGSNDIYLVDSLKRDYANNNAVDFYEAISLGIEYTDLYSVHFDRKNDGLSLDTNVEFSNGIAEFSVYKPYIHKTSSYYDNLIDTLIYYSFSDFVDIKENELSNYDLVNPTYHFVFSTKNGTKTELCFSKNINENYYGFIKGANKYFVVPKNQFSGMELSEIVLIDPYICYCYVRDISTIIGSYGNKSFKFELAVDSSNSIMSAESTVLLDGRNAKITDSSGRSYCSLLFESIACIKIGGIEISDMTKPSSEAELTLTFIDKNYVTTVYEFYPKGTDSYYVFKNGEYTNFYVYSTEIFNDGKEDTYNYGFWKAYELLTNAITDNMNGIYDL